MAKMDGIDPGSMNQWVALMPSTGLETIWSLPLDGVEVRSRKSGLCRLRLVDGQKGFACITL